MSYKPTLAALECFHADDCSLDVDGIGCYGHGQAMQWYREAVEHGSTDTFFEIGLLYERGLGVPPDLPAAIDWYRKAAKEGDKRATARLAALKNGGAQASGPEIHPGLGSIQYRCFLQVDVDSARLNVGKAESDRRHDECMRSNWKSLFGTPYPEN